eukprot:Polyplicarium_translucidae@DN3403_c1_g1_i11.p1
MAPQKLRPHPLPLAEEELEGGDAVALLHQASPGGDVGGWNGPSSAGVRDEDSQNEGLSGIAGEDDALGRRELAPPGVRPLRGDVQRLLQVMARTSTGTSTRRCRRSFSSSSTAWLKSQGASFEPCGTPEDCAISAHHPVLHEFGVGLPVGIPRCFRSGKPATVEEGVAVGTAGPFILQHSEAQHEEMGLSAVSSDEASLGAVEVLQDLDLRVEEGERPRVVRGQRLPILGDWDQVGVPRWGRRSSAATLYARYGTPSGPGDLCQPSRRRTAWTSPLFTCGTGPAGSQTTGIGASGSAL